jgi:hypothetical protein
MKRRPSTYVGVCAGTLKFLPVSLSVPRQSRIVLWCAIPLLHVDRYVNRLLSYLFSLCRWVLQMMFLLRTLVDAPGFSFTHSLHNIPKVPRPGKRRTPKIWSASWRACIRALTAHVTSQILFPVTRQMFQTASLSRNGYARPITKWICA